MKVPLQTQFRGMEPSDFVANNIWDHVEKLETFYDRILSCRVIVSAPHRHKTRGKIYHIQVMVLLPGGSVYVSTEPEKNGAHEDIYVAVRDAFAATKRKLEDFIRRRRSQERQVRQFARAKVTKIFPFEGFGFIQTADDREVYFHKNSVLDKAFEDLRIGDEVSFSEEQGEKGPQVTSMKVSSQTYEQDLEQ